MNFHLNYCTLNQHPSTIGTIYNMTTGIIVIYNRKLVEICKIRYIMFIVNAWFDFILTLCRIYLLLLTTVACVDSRYSSYSTSTWFFWLQCFWYMYSWVRSGYSINPFQLPGHLNLKNKCLVISGSLNMFFLQRKTVSLILTGSMICVNRELFSHGSNSHDENHSVDHIHYTLVCIK